MDSRQIQHFLAAVEHRNLGRAAGELGISQPALSKSIQRLERHLGVKLLERGRFGVSPTIYGDALATHGKIVDAELRHAESEIDALRGARRGHVLLGCGPAEATRLLPVAVAHLFETHPELRLTALYGLNETLMPLVRRGEIDFALSSVPSSSNDVDLVHEPLYSETTVVAARAGHPLSRRRNVEPADLAGYRWVLARRRERERRALDELFLAAGLAPPDAAIETSSTVLMKSMVLQSDFLTYLPLDLIYWEEKRGELVPLMVHGPLWSRQVGITWRRRGSLSPATRALIDVLRVTASRFGFRSAPGPGSKNYTRRTTRHSGGSSAETTS